jgi:head-tail adaptor
MRMGQFNREITVYRQEDTQDPVYGAAAGTWVPLSLLPGSPEVAERFAAEVVDLPPSRNEGVLAGSLALARKVTRIRMRWRDDILSSMRIVVHGDTDRTYQIAGGPSEIGGRKVGIEMYCEEISS